MSESMPDTGGTWMNVQFDGRRRLWLLKYFDGERTFQMNLPPWDAVEMCDVLINTASVLKETLLEQPRNPVPSAGEEFFYKVGGTDSD